MKIYTVTVEGRFSYDKSTYCDVSREKGFFTESFLSLWDSSVWINGDAEGSTAFVNTYGTATMRLSIAQIFGINPILQAQEYSLILECDKYGNTSATWDLN